MSSIFVIEWFANKNYNHEYFKTAEAAFARFIMLRDDDLTPIITQHTVHD